MPLSKQSAFVWAVFVSVLAGLLAALAARAQNRDEDEHKRIPKRIVADYTSGAKFLNPPYDVAQIPFHKLTHIIHAGIPWNSDGSLYIEKGFVEPDPELADLLGQSRPSPRRVRARSQCPASRRALSKDRPRQA